MPEAGQSVAIGMIEAGGAGGAGKVRVLGRETVAPPARDHDDLMPAIDRLMIAAGAQPREIALVAVSIGPGGFTALRVAVATAKMIAFASGGRCIAVPSALVAAWGAEDGGAALAVALSVKNDTAHVTIFAAGFRTNAEQPPPGRVMGPAEITRLDVPLLLADQHLSAPLRAAAHSKGMVVAAPRFEAVHVLHAAAGWGGLPAMDPQLLLPLYAREPEAVTLWRARHGAGNP